MDLKSAEGLKTAVDAALSRRTAEEGFQHWRRSLTDYLRWAGSADRNTRASPAFQKRLWDDNPVSATGQGHISIDRAIGDRGFCEFVAGLFDASLPAEGSEQPKHLLAIYEELLSRITAFTTRQPRLKILRVMAVIFPGHFTTITRGPSLRKLHTAMFERDRKRDLPALSQDILGRIRSICGIGDDSLEGTVELMTIPWILFEDYIEKTEDEAVGEISPTGEVKLLPMPAARRRRGLLSIGGYVNTLSAVLEFVKEGAQKEDLHEHIRSIHPQLKPSSINTQINALIAEWGALKNDNGVLHLTDRAEAFLESGDPHEFAGWLLTRVLGFDNALFLLREKGPQSQKAVYSELKQANPGWTSDFAPSAMLTWLRELKLVAISRDRVFSLTEEGLQWAQEIHWIPERLTAETGLDERFDKPVAVTAVLQATPRGVQEVISLAGRQGHFDSKVIARLHHGLWLRSQRHFAVLAGLSGAGKTLLANAYAQALAENPEDPSTNMLILPVQPGWYDPTPLLGYINPFESETYQRTPFLELLMAAVQDPTQPYTVVLDEMNLSHPEQYLAPLLSAMETGGVIQLHSGGDELDGVPARLPYPANLVLIGTVNMDETTHALSDKVLDRAFVLEFWDVDVAGCPAWETVRLPAEQRDAAKSLLMALHDALRPVRLHFGWRLIEDVLGYLQAAVGGGVLDASTAMDDAIFAKVLPKLRGEDSERLRRAFEQTLAVLKQAGLPESTRKLGELLDDLKHTGSARFWR